MAANASALRTALDEAVVYSRKNNLMTHTTGMSIFMPDGVDPYYEDLAEYSGLAFSIDTGCFKHPDKTLLIKYSRDHSSFNGVFKKKI